MGRYVPPDLEGTASFNQASGKRHPLGVRARKLKSEGILTVRFECPFPIWCSNCKPEQIIGQGVRFNAEKKKVGNYYTTPIWSFRFKHTVCGQWVEVRTDPKNTEYVVLEGGRRRDTGEDKVLDGEVRVGLTEEDKQRLKRDGGFGALEKKVEDKQRLLSERGRLEELAKRSHRDWEDPYEQSKRLRREFRIGRRMRKEAEVKGESLKDKLSLGIDLVAEQEEDAIRATLIDFAAPNEGETDTRPMFPHDRPPSKLNIAKERGKRGRHSSPLSQFSDRKLRLQERLSGNSRATVDPFLNEQKVWQPTFKQKNVQQTAHPKSDDPVPQSVTLVDYESDSV